MNNNLVLELSKMVDLTKNDFSVILPFFKTKHYKKGEFFLEEGKLCNHVGFVDKGLFNYFYLDNGTQRIRGFFFPNNFISNYSCFLENNKSKAFIQAMEDCTVTLLHKDDLNFLYETLPSLPDGLEVFGDRCNGFETAGLPLSPMDERAFATPFFISLLRLLTANESAAFLFLTALLIIGGGVLETTTGRF